MIYQAWLGTKEAMEWLLTRQPRAYVNMINDQGLSALWYATANNDPDKVRLLLEYGALRTFSDNEGVLPLTYARDSYKDKVISILAEYFPEPK